MPYGTRGSNKEHVANVSATELPKFDVSFKDYINNHPTKEFPDFFSNGQFNEDKVIPRLLLGNYLEHLFKYYITTLIKRGIKVKSNINTEVTDIKVTDQLSYQIITDTDDYHNADIVILCTGHHWPKTYEDQVSGWYDSPYPPSKFNSPFNGSVAIRGSSLTAVDAVKTLARINGSFLAEEDGQLSYQLNPQSLQFKMTLFSTGGFLPALRFHSDGEAYSSSWVMSLKDIYEYKTDLLI